MSTENELWGIRITGSDDIYAMESKEEAERRQALDTAYAESMRMPESRRAEVVPWPYSAELHASEIERFARNPLTEDEILRIARRDG